MFSLIITIISIALVAALAIATLYYGGDSHRQGAVKATAATLVNQGMQIAAAGAVATVQGPGWPAVSPSFSQPYLAAMPVPPKQAYFSGTPSADDWLYYQNDRAAHHFILDRKINRAVCMEVNRSQGFTGIPAAWDGKSIIQCFGSSEPYTFFYDPPGTAAQKAAALEKSIAEGGTGAAAGYPRLCPDGTSITAGVCASTGAVVLPPPGNGEVVPPPNQPGYTLTAPGAVDTTPTDMWGNPLGFVLYCSPDAPPGTFAMDTLVTVDGTPVTVQNAYPSMGMNCLETTGNPPHSAGTVPVRATSISGSTASGTLRYVTAFASPPTVSSISPTSGPADEKTAVVLTGSGFIEGAQAYVDGALLIPTTFIDATHLRVTMPLRETLQYSDFSQAAGIFVSNPESARSEPQSFYFDKPVVLDVTVVNWTYKGSDVLALVCPVDPANPDFTDIWQLPPITVGTGAAFVSNDRLVPEAGGGPYLIYSDGPWPDFVGHWAATAESSKTYGWCHEVPIPAADAAGTTIQLHSPQQVHSVQFSTATTPQGPVATRGWSGDNSCPNSRSPIRVPRGYMQC